MDCQAHQPQPNRVTVLTGNFGDRTTRSCTVRAGKPLFFPVANCFFANADLGKPCDSDADCEAFDPPVVCGSRNTCVENFSVKEKVDLCEVARVDNHCGMEVKLDGRRVYPAEDGIPLLRTASLPTPGFDINSGNFDPEIIASGHWALIPKLPIGQHRLRFQGSRKKNDGTPAGAVCGSGFSSDITYELMVVD